MRSTGRLAVVENKPLADRRTNPIFNSNKLKLGTFATNVSYGGAVTTAQGTFQPTWANVTELATIADRAGMEALVPVARWRGMGGKTDFSGSSYETFTWAAGLGGMTTHASVFATCHMPTIHPIVAAKQSTTIDHITNGRFTLNVVCGWFSPEMEMFGAPVKEHEARYDYAEEWLEIAKLLWAGEDNFDFKGRFFTINKGWHQPKPIQLPYPAIMNAGASARGRDFAAKHSDIMFTTVTTDLDASRAEIEGLKEYAHEKYGRDVQIWTNSYCVISDTDAEAQAYLRYYVEEKGDWEAVDNMMRVMGITTASMPPQTAAKLRYHFAAGYAGFPLIGCAQTIAERLKLLCELGVAGVVLTFARYRDDLIRFTEEVLPMLVAKRLRQA
jgi:alkanesulfonate monooxygenase SsuD/methylene tetrahydromethanopterin reductase-like flavin-dependent oxidoreductase (luciferase family)